MISTIPLETLGRWKERKSWLQKYIWTSSSCIL